MADVSPAVRSELAPTGKLRVGLDMSNFLLTATDAATGKPKGLAADMGTELARRLGVPVGLVPFPSPGAVADAARTGAWDVGFIGAEPQRAAVIEFTSAYVEIPATYLVPAGSPIRSIEEVDRPGIRVATAARSAYDLYLSRNLKHAQLVRAEGLPASFDLFVAEKLDVLSGLLPRLTTDVARLPGARILEGRFTAIQQAIGTPKARAAGAAYLREFVADIKASGLVADLIARHGIKGIAVAP